MIADADWFQRAMRNILRRIFPVLVAAAFISHAHAAALDEFTLEQVIGPKKENARLTFKYVRKRPDNAELDRIIAKVGSRTQTLRVDFSETVFTPEEHRAATKFSDLNGDGYKDLLVPIYVTSGNQAFYVWIYDPDTREFIFCPELTGERNPEPRKNGTVEAFSRDGGQDFKIQTFQWDGRRFIPIRKYVQQMRDTALYETSSQMKDGKWVEEFSRPVKSK